MYAYETEKPRLFTESGQVMFLAIRDAARKLLSMAGAFRQQELLLYAKTGGDTWQQSACIDRLVELGEIVEVKRDCWQQYRVFTTREVHGL